MTNHPARVNWEQLREWASGVHLRGHPHSHVEQALIRWVARVDELEKELSIAVAEREHWKKRYKDLFRRYTSVTEVQVARATKIINDEAEHGD